MQNITLSADGVLIETARERARVENTTLNEQFRRWLASYAQRDQRALRLDAVLTEMRGSVTVGRKLTRDEMNAR